MVAFHGTCNAISHDKSFVLFISTFQYMCAVHNTVLFLFRSLISCFSGLLLRHFLKHSEMVPVAPVITGTTSVSRFHVCCTWIIWYYYYLDPILLETVVLRVPNQNFRHLVCLMTTLNVETVFSLDALRQQVPSTISNGRPVSS